MDDDLTYVDKIVRIAELASEESTFRLKGFTWRHCRIIGPAVIIPVECTMDGCSYGGPPEAVLWEIPEGRPGVVGAILVNDCVFDRCSFYGVGFAGTADFVQSMKDSARKPNETTEG